MNSRALYASVTPRRPSSSPRDLVDLLQRILISVTMLKQIILGKHEPWPRMVYAGFVLVLLGFHHRHAVYQLR